MIDGAMSIRKLNLETIDEAQRVDDGRDGLKRDMPLVPAASIAGRALVTVIAIMTFLASLTAGAAMLIAETSQDWRQSIAREMTVQVRPIVGRDLEAETAKAVDVARGFPGIAEVRAYTKSEIRGASTALAGRRAGPVGTAGAAADRFETRARCELG